MMLYFFFFKQKTAYEMRISDWSSDVCSSDLPIGGNMAGLQGEISDPQIMHLIVQIVWNLQLTETGFDGDLPPGNPADKQIVILEIGRASCRERVCQYV